MRKIKGLIVIVVLMVLTTCGPSREVKLMSVESVTYDTTFIMGDTIVHHRHKTADKPMDRKIMWIAVGGVILIILGQIFLR